MAYSLIAQDYVLRDQLLQPGVRDRLHIEVAKEIQGACYVCARRSLGEGDEMT